MLNDTSDVGSFSFSSSESESSSSSDEDFDILYVDKVVEDILKETIAEPSTTTTPITTKR